MEEKENKLIPEKQNETFWKRLDSFLQNNRLVVDRSKGTCHPKYTEVIYPIDYGYLVGTDGGDGNGVDVWVCSKGEKTLDAIVCTVDI